MREDKRTETDGSPAENDDWLLNGAEIDEAENLKAPAGPAEAFTSVIGKEPAFLKGEETNPRQREGFGREFVINFRDLMIANDITIKDIAGKVPEDVVWGWLRGRLEPTLDDWKALEAVFGVPAAEGARRAFRNGMLFTPGYVAIFYRRQAQNAQRRLRKFLRHGRPATRCRVTRKSASGNKIRRQTKQDPIEKAGVNFVVAERIVKIENVTEQLCQAVINHSRQLEGTIQSLQSVNAAIKRRSELTTRCLIVGAFVLVLAVGFAASCYFGQPAVVAAPPVP